MNDASSRGDLESQSLSGRYRAAGVRFTDVVAFDPVMRSCLAQAERLAAAELGVLLLGETGTGKNLIAQAMHNASARRVSPFVEITCGAISETLAEAELFGHAAGAFTGAVRSRTGWIECANGGTLFLDEVDDLPLGTQAKLLRVLERGEFATLGSSTTRHANVRVIAATSRDMTTKCADGSFRHDLFQRLAEATLCVPALRERKSDISHLAGFFLAELAARSGRTPPRLDPFAERLLLEHSWPGNVRELRSAIRRGVALADGEFVTAQDLGLRVDFDSATRESVGVGNVTDLSLATFERRHIERVLRLTDFNKSLASRALGIARNTLDRKIEEYRMVSDPTDPADPRRGTSSE